MTNEFSAGNLTTRRIEPQGRPCVLRQQDECVPVVLVTGGGGFLGTHIVKRLLARGDMVRVLGRRRYPHLEALGVDCRQGDVADESAVRKAMEGCGAVVHTAAIPGVWGEYKTYYNANYVGTKNIIDAAIANGVRKLVYTSTPSVVHGGRDIEGGDETLPYPEHYLTHYASTKALAEKLVLNMNSGSFATLAIRPHLMFGPGDTQLIPKLLARASAGRLRRVGNGENLVSVSYIENVADAHLLALDTLAPGCAAAGQAYFINEPEPVKCWDFINRIVVGAGLPQITRGVPYRLAYAAGWLCETLYEQMQWQTDPPMTRFLADQLATSHWFRVDKARRDLGWKPMVPLDEGVRRTLNSLRSENDSEPDSTPHESS